MSRGRKQIPYIDTRDSYNQFCKNISADNTNYVKALILVQTDIVREVLNNRQKMIVEYAICQGIPQKRVAAMLHISPSALNRELKSALNKLRHYIIFCDKALKYYQGMEE